MAVRRKRITEEKAARFVQDLLSLPIKIDPENALQACGRVFALAQQHKLTAYDAAYLDLAMRSGVPLASLHNELRKAATAAGVLLS